MSKGWNMNATTKGVEALKDEIRHEIRAIFKMNMKFESWNVPEADNHEASRKIIDVMQKAINELKDEIKAGDYENY
jgi:DNA-directed RNA polymerase subunit L